ncbi:CHAT domain-containing protein [Flavobacterium haoranii]|uniref:CHAT domain-containing protein n=1 Tax=Flavobacterium haoranii TaxID=683124 RepID=A0A1M6IXM7_9FLAO|nr:CHAT domain-containing tetratricopeptide repeat protein [Flavobacterium haoranii]SHJ39161.1 CHAT domain-containing protein [Flavobacterium haoranii]
MKSFLASIFLLVVCFSFAQPNGFNDYYAVFMEGYNNKNLPKMKEGSELLILNFPDEFAGYYLNSYYHICSGNLKQAQVESNKALNIQPLLPYSYYTQAYIHYLNNNVSEAEKSLNFAVQLNTDKNPDAIFKDMDVIGYFLSKDISSLKGKYSKIFHTYNNPDLALQFDQCFNEAIKGTPCDKIDQLAAKYNTLQPVNPLISKLAPLVKATSFYAKGNITECKKQFETFLNNSKANQALYWQRSYAYWFLSILKRDSFDERGAFLDINAALEEYQNLGFSSYQLANMQLHKIHVLDNFGDKEQEKLQMAYQLEQTANALNNNYYKAKAYNSIGAHYLLDGPQPEMNKAGEYLTKAFNLAKSINDKDLSREVNSNYIIIKAKQGLYTDAAKITEETAQGYISDKVFDHAQNLYNNLGFIFYNNKDYKNAIIQFEKSIALAEKVKSTLNSKQKLKYMNDISGVYTGLIMSYKQTNNVEKLFQLQEQSRSGYLKEMLNSNLTTATIVDAQNLLKPNEVLLTYTIGQPGEIIITVITKNKAEIRYNYPIDQLLALKKVYTDKVKKIPAQLNPYMKDLQVDYKDGQLVRYASKQSAYKKDDFVMLVEWTRQLLEQENPQLQNVQNDFLHLWYDLTLQPVQDVLNNYSKVIISASAELNYLPFETFLSPKNQYFVSTHDVRYIPNTTIWKIIANRNYSSNRKSVLAFGGAKYQPSGNVKPRVRGIEDFYKVSDAVNQKISKGIYNFKPELEALGFGGANYLAGTLQEVEFVGNLSSDIKVYKGFDMSESNFKKANASGELKQYKNLLISTHGFTSDIIPEFSGVMFSQPNGGDGNEDTFLLVPEISILSLNTDLVILSACDTGIGKLYGGEGINGLNSAFLVAGSNATMLSLWPVSDAGTALTMQNLFKKVVQQNGNTTETLNQIKRSFIKGDFGSEFKHPQFWAPFLYNGR